MDSIKIEDDTYTVLSRCELSRIELRDIKSKMVELRISPCAQCVFEKIYLFIKYKGKAFPGSKYLAMKIGVSSRTIRRALQALVHSKMIIIEERQGTTNRYHVRPEQLADILMGKVRAEPSPPGHSVHPRGQYGRGGGQNGHRNKNYLPRKKGREEEKPCDDLSVRLARAAARPLIQGDELVLLVPTRKHAEYVQGMAKELNLEAQKWEVKGWRIEIAPER